MLYLPKGHLILDANKTDFLYRLLLYWQSFCRQAYKANILPLKKRTGFLLVSSRITGRAPKSIVNVIRLLDQTRQPV